MSFAKGSVSHMKYLAYQRKRLVKLRKAGLCVSCAKPVAEKHKYTRCKACRDKRARREYALSQCRICGSQTDVVRGYCVSCGYGAINILRYAAMQKLGLKCVCCKERELLFLNFDHIDGNGRYDRKDSDRRRLYRSILDSDRKDIRLLCFNCNLGRELNGGVCPHKRIVVKVPRRAAYHHLEHAKALMRLGL